MQRRQHTQRGMSMAVRRTHAQQTHRQTTYSGASECFVFFFFFFTFSTEDILSLLITHATPRGRTNGGGPKTCWLCAVRGAEECHCQFHHALVMIR